MANYIKTTDFAVKDSLVTGDPNKRVRGTETDVEFSNISTAISTKVDLPNGSPPSFLVRAWMNLNGIGPNISIRGSGNVSSVTYFGEGSYVVNFATAMEDANYSASAAAEGTGGFAFRTTTCSQYTTTALNVRVGNVIGTPNIAPQGIDNPTVSMTVVR